MTRSSDSTSWSLVDVDDTLVAALSTQTGLSATTCRVLAGRGVATPEAVERFFSPSLDRDWLDPGRIPGMPAAAEAVAEAVRAREHVVVFGDFDLDGISSAAVAARGLEAMGARVTAVVPHRFNEGYGLSAAAIERLMLLRPDLLVTVDCGVSAADEVALLAERGVKVVVTDHHEPGDRVPVGVPLANPKLDAAGCESADLSGAGVALKLVQSVGDLLGFADVWRGLTDLAALGTIADIVPLGAENRALVADGLAQMRSNPRVAVAALAAVAGVALDALSSETVAYALAPRLNAAGRMADPQVALDLLLTDDAQLAESLSRTLDEYNRSRQAVEADLSEVASAMAERVYAGERALVLSGEGWHEGVKGIVASRLAKRFGVPVLLFAIEDGVALGSGRSVGTVDLFRALESCSDVLTRFGGHASAVGCVLPAEDIERFAKRLVECFDGVPEEQFEAERTVDAVVELEEVSVELGAEFALLEPFGCGNRQPVLGVEGVFMNGRQRVGKLGNHLRFVAFDGAAGVQAIAFRRPDIERLVAHDAAVDLAFTISADEWRGRQRVQMRVEDVALHDAEAGARAYELVEDLFARADEILAREEYAGIGDAPSFHTKLAGVTFEDRQEMIGRLSTGVPLRLVRQPENPFDANACALFDPHGDHVGFLNRRLAAALAPSIDTGVAYDVEVTEVTGGEDGRSLGVNVLVTRRDAVLEEERRASSRADVRAELSALSEAELDAELVRRFLGERDLHAAQRQSLSHLSVGKSTLTVMATGRGKSLIFHLHAARLALRSGRASVFVYPLRALVSDQAHHLEEAFAEVGIAARTVTGESSATERDRAFADLRGGSLDVVLTTPEFLHLHAERFAASGRVRFVVVDEAHHVGLARAGHRPAYARLGEALATLDNPTALAVTATADDATAETIRESLGIDVTVVDPTVRENLAIEDHRGAADRDAYVEELVLRGEKTVVYVNSRDHTVRLARRLRKRVPGMAMRTAFYNGGMSRQMRHAVEHAFRANDIRIIIATSAFGEGVNIPDIRNVVLFHLPFNSVEFNQMSGRAGRDGALARIHLLFGIKDARINTSILSTLAPDRDDMAALYVTLRDIAAAQGTGFEVTNAELAERCKQVRRTCGLDERGVSSALGILRDLGFVTGEGHGTYRRLTFTPGEERVDLERSVRYVEGKDEIAEFHEFKSWALAAEAKDLLARFNRPILPTLDDTCVLEHRNLQ